MSAKEILKRVDELNLLYQDIYLSQDCSDQTFKEFLWLTEAVKELSQALEFASDRDGYFDAKNHKVYEIINRSRDTLAKVAGTTKEDG